MLRNGLSSELNASAKRLDQHFEPNVVNINKYLKHQEKGVAIAAAAAAAAAAGAEDSFDSGDIWRNEKHNWLRGHQQQQQQQQQRPRGGDDWLSPPPQQGIGIGGDDNWSTTGTVTTNLSVMAGRHLSPPKFLVTSATGDNDDDFLSDATSNDGVGDLAGAERPGEGEGRGGMAAREKESSEDAMGERQVGEEFLCNSSEACRTGLTLVERW